MAQYEVICEGPQGQPVFWDGVNLRRKGEIVEIDPEVVKVSDTSRALKPVGAAPVWKNKTDKDGVQTHEKSTRKADRNDDRDVKPEKVEKPEKAERHEPVIPPHKHEPPRL